MKPTKEEIAKLYEEYEYYIGYIVWYFLAQHPTFIYMKQDMMAECAYRFVQIMQKYDGNISKISTYLHTQLPYYLMNMLAKEAKLTTGEALYIEELETWDAYVDEAEPEDLYAFDDIILNARCSTQQREVLRRKFVYDQQDEVIASELGISQQAVNRIYQRAKERIKQRIEDDRLLEEIESQE